MSLKIYLIVLIFFPCVNKSFGTLECPRINYPCNNISTDGRFKYFHVCPHGSEIFVSSNKTMLAYHVFGNLMPNNSSVEITNDSVLTTHCQDLEVKCIVHIGDNKVDEICLDYKVAVTPNPDSSQPPTTRNPIIGGAVVGAVGGAVIGAVGVAGLILLIGVLCYMWKRKDPLALTVPCFLQYLRCSCLRKEIVADDVGTTQPNCDIRLNEIPATDSCGSGGSAIKQDDTLESVHVHSIDPPVDGQPPQSFSLDRNSSKPGIQPTASGDVVVSDGSGASNHRAMNSLRDDPGAENDNNGKAIVGIARMDSGWTAGDRAPEDPGSEEQPLLSKQRAADQGLDMTGKAGALVHMHGFDPDQVSRCSIVPGTDVESTPNMNNYSINTDL